MLRELVHILIFTKYFFRFFCKVSSCFSVIHIESKVTPPCLGYYGLHPLEAERPFVQWFQNLGHVTMASVSRRVYVMPDLNIYIRVGEILEVGGTDDTVLQLPFCRIKNRQNKNE